MPIDIEQILPQSTLPPYQRSRLLFSWLSQDDARLALYEALNAEQVQAVEFQGRDKVDNEVQGEPILVCRGLRGTWPSVWERMRFLS